MIELLQEILIILFWLLSLWIDHERCGFGVYLTHVEAILLRGLILLLLLGLVRLSFVRMVCGAPCIFKHHHHPLDVVGLA